VIGCPVPRPVGIISDTERVHQSAWERRDDSAVASGDIYKRAARRRWLKAMDVRKISRSDLEKAWADEDRPARPRMKIPKKLDPCARVLSFVGGRG
jgi:hypothetical protein